MFISLVLAALWVLEIHSLPSSNDHAKFELGQRFSHWLPGTGTEDLHTFSDNVIFVPPSDYNTPKVLYARSVELQDGTLLATWENYSPEPPLVYYPIFQSTDSGVTWKEISKVQDQVNGWGLRYQPFLYLLPRGIGDFPAGTILCAGNSIPEDLSKTQIDLYSSKDNGYTWNFVSRIAAGGEALPDDGLTPIWEPFLMMYKNEMIVYYSDQRDPAHAQKLTLQTSTNLRNWTDAVTAVAYSDYYARPGMMTVTELPNGQYMATYEYGGAPGYVTYSFPAFYRISDSPLLFNEAPDHAIISYGIHPQSSPYITWSSVGGPFGSIIVSCGTLQPLFVNRALGAVDEWEIYDVPQPVAYTRSLRVFEQNPNYLLIMGAGLNLASPMKNVSCSVVELSQGPYCSM